jgi:hypothetical protein
MLRGEGRGVWCCAKGCFRGVTWEVQKCGCVVGGKWKISSRTTLSLIADDAVFSFYQSSLPSKCTNGLREPHQ